MDRRVRYRTKPRLPQVRLARNIRRSTCGARALTQHDAHCVHRAIVDERDHTALHGFAVDFEPDDLGAGILDEDLVPRGAVSE